jgi:hypothetical protein
MKRVMINGIEYQFTEEQLEAAMVKEKFDWEDLKLNHEELVRAMKDDGYGYSYIPTLQSLCLQEWNKRAIESNRKEKVDWEDPNQIKYYPYIGYHYLIQVNRAGRFTWFIGEHHLSEESYQEAIEYFGDEFMRCLMGVNIKN